MSAGLEELRQIRLIGDGERDDPSSEIIELMRRSYRPEREIDLQLTQKMQRRGEARRTSLELGDISRSLDKFLAEVLEGPFEVADQRWLSGGASKLQMGFTLHREVSGLRESTALVVRMDPQESMNATSRLREFQLIEQFVGKVPVPRPYWLDADGTWFPQPALIYALVPGVSKPTGVNTRVAGSGTLFGPELRARLAPGFVEHLAAIHTARYDIAQLSAFDEPEVGTTQTVDWQLDRARRIWEEDRGEELPLVDAASAWLQRNRPVLDKVSMLHGDYRTGNLLFDEELGQITGVLDWERGYLGDRHRDLAWTLLPSTGAVDKDGTRLVSGLLPVDEFLGLYGDLTGLPIDEDKLRYYRVLNGYQIAVSVLGSGYRVAKLGKSHQDILLMWLEGAGQGVLVDLRDAILEAENG